MRHEDLEVGEAAGDGIEADRALVACRSVVAAVIAQPSQHPAVEVDEHPERFGAGIDGPEAAVIVEGGGDDDLERLEAERVELIHLVGPVEAEAHIAEADDPAGVELFAADDALVVILVEERAAGGHPDPLDACGGCLLHVCLEVTCSDVVMAVNVEVALSRGHVSTPQVAQMVAVI